MTNFEVDPFALLNADAAVINVQNARYDQIGMEKDPRWAPKYQAPVIKEQANYLQVLGDLAADLPYEELIAAHMAAEAELAAIKEHLANMNNEVEVGVDILALHALASRVMHEWGVADETAEAGVKIRKAEIIAAKRLPWEQRRDEQVGWFGRLSMLLEVAGQAWPRPYAHAPQDEPVIVEPQRPTLLKEVVIHIDDEGLAAVKKRHGEAIRSTSLRERQIDQPHASSLIAVHLAANVGRTITVDELIHVLYAHCIEEGEDLRGYRSRVTTMMGPKIQGERIQAMLEPKGHTIWYGKRRTWVREETKNKPTYQGEHRVYRTISLIEAQAALPEFVEIALDGEVVGSTHDFNGHRTQQPARLVLAS